MSKRIAERLSERLEHELGVLVPDDGPTPLYELSLASLRRYPHPVMMITFVVDPEEPPPHAKAGQYTYSTRFIIEFHKLDPTEIRDVTRKGLVDIGYLPGSALREA